MSDFKKLLLLLIAVVFIAHRADAQYQLRINYIGKDTSFQPASLKLQTNFTNRRLCEDYVNKLPAQLNLKGYLSASIDSVHYDADSASIQLYPGNQQHWAQLRVDSIDKVALEACSFDNRNFKNEPVNMYQLQLLEQQLLNYYEKNGYPFAAVFLDSITMVDDGMNAMLKLRKGPLYHIDSIHVQGDVIIDNYFLQQYLGVVNGSLYNIEKLQQVDKRIATLSYLRQTQPSNLTMLGSGCILNLYLQQKKNNQIDVLIGFAPANTQTNKLQFTGSANLNLKNSFGKGETIALKWQQLQQSSPRLNLGYQQPYVFKSSFGLDFAFDMYKKDSTYLQLSAQMGLQYLLSANQSGKLFIQTQSTILLASGVDTAQVIATKTLPPNIDVSSVNIGVDYKWNNTNYHFNPLKGNELSILASVGTKTIKKNTTILGIVDTFNYASLYDTVKLHSYQFRVTASMAHYFQLGRQSTLKMVGNIGLFNSQNIFLNELFQIGGYKLMRGFDEESIYATQYGVATAEYHYLIGQNSYLFGFIDKGWVKNKYQGVNIHTNYTGFGIGMEFETKLGLLNISYAIGTQSNQAFNLNGNSKIHFGYINYF